MMPGQGEGLSDSAIIGLVDILIDIEREDIADFQRLIDIVPGFRHLLEEEKCKLPYSINLLDEIHANENAHSRILRKLLMFSETTGSISKYPIFGLFLKYLGYPFADLAQIKPVITAERARIDLLIRDRDYSIIIENKINGAGDQEEQLKRYVEKLTTANVREDNIYVLYLSADGGSPSESSWPDTMRKRFGCRYREINYRDDVYRFLNDDANWYVTAQQETTAIEFLRSALHQYVDYLEGRFHYRKGEQTMRDKTRAYLEEKIGLTDPSLTTETKIILIRNQIEILNEISNSLYETQNELLRDAVNKAKSEICDIVRPHVGTITTIQDFGQALCRIRFFPHAWNSDYCVSIGFERYYDGFFIGIENINGKDISVDNNISKLLQKELGTGEQATYHWIYSVYKAQGENAILDYFTSSISIAELSKEIIAIAESTRVNKIISES